MTEKDKELIQQAWAISSLFWEKAYDLIDLAETEEARARLHSIACLKKQIDEDYGSEPWI